MKTCLGCVVVLLLIACIFVIPWGSINWGNAVCGVFSIIGWLCLIGGAILYLSALAEFAQANPHPIIAFISIIAALTRPHGIGGFLLFFLGLFLVASIGSC
jgi:hypothetical protein